MAAQKAQSPAMEFLVESLKKDKNASYADLKAKADEKKLEVYPIMFGRAQALLGIVKSAKRGQGKAARQKAAAAKPAASAAVSSGGSTSAQARELLKAGMSVADIAAKLGCRTGLVYNLKSKMGLTGARGPGRPPMARVATKAITRPPAAALNGLEGIVAAVRSAEQQRARLRDALERIQAVLADVLA